jgi:hypothetical protein
VALPVDVSKSHHTSAGRSAARKSTIEVAHRTDYGRYVRGKTEDLLRSPAGKRLRGKVQLILTSPPFPLNHKKSYGNLDGDAYRKWFVSVFRDLTELLAPRGSIVIELGNAWEKKRPLQSLLPLQCLLDLTMDGGGSLKLCQEFVCYNPARLPSPAQWVTVTRERVTDSFTRIWWLSRVDRPNADNSRVLRPYSASMKALFRRKSYNDAARPSEHHISPKSFLRRNGGSISHNLFEAEPLSLSREVRLPNVFAMANTTAGDHFTATCRERGVTPHPARMPVGLAAFFVEFLTQKGQLVLDPFGGSNTTGFAAELLSRRWLTVEVDGAYAKQSRIRLSHPVLVARRKSRKKGRRRRRGDL